MARKKNPNAPPRKTNSKRPSGPKPKETLAKPIARKARSSIPTLSKQDQVVAMLRHPEGTTIAAIGKATGWKKHTVRGFFSAVVRRKLHLELVSEIRDGTRVYRVVGP